jgi:hypothetical protein
LTNIQAKAVICETEMSEDMTWQSIEPEGMAHTQGLKTASD